MPSSPPPSNLAHSGQGNPPRQPSTQRLGPYLLLSQLGEGGMGVVWKAKHLHLNRLVALKTLTSNRLTDPKFLRRFQREWKALGQLDHPNIVHALDAGEADDFHYLAMELIDGIDLRKLVHQRGQLSVADACELARQTAEALDYIFRQDLVHRDIKPSNLMLTRWGHVKVLDLGLARLALEQRSQEELTASGQMMGTPDYVSPEQVQESHTVDIRADIYSLGCTLYHLLAGQPPFIQYVQPYRKALAHIHEPLPSLGALRPDLPEALDHVVQRLVAKDPAQRVLTPAEAARALQPFTLGNDPRRLLADQSDASFAAAVTVQEISQRESVPELNGLSTTAPLPGRMLPLARVSLAFLVLAILVLPLLIGSHATIPPVDSPKRRGADESIDWPPGKWHKLLDQYPVVLALPSGDAPRWSVSVDRVEVTLDCRRRRLLQLGTTSAKRYRLRTVIHQAPWTGSLGVFFGHQRVRLNGNDYAAYNFLELQREIPKPTQEKFTLLGGFQSHPLQNQRGGIRIFPLSSLIDQPGFVDHKLDATIGPKGIEEVRWDGKLRPDFAMTDKARKLVPPNFPIPSSNGGVGVYCEGAAATFINPEIQILEEVPHGS